MKRRRICIRYIVRRRRSRILSQGRSGVFGSLAAVPSNITTPLATINAATVNLGGLGGLGMGSLGLGATPGTGSPLTGAGSGSPLLGAASGFGLGGAQSAGVAQSLGSGLTSFGLSPNGTALPGGDIMGRFLGAAQAGGLTNPFALATLAAYGKHESGWSAANATRSWSDPSVSGVPGTSGGLLSWRNERLASMRSFTAGDSDPASAQGRFFLQENPALIRQLQGAGSLEEANRLMANAWKFKGYDSQGGEYGARLGTSRSYLNQFGSDRRADLDAAKSLETSTGEATKSMADLGDAASKLPDAVGSAENSLGSLASSLLNFKPGGAGGFDVAGMFGGGSGSGAGGMFVDGVTSFSANGNVLTPRGPMALDFFADGGIAPAGRPVVNVIGEGAMNEAIVPLPDGRSIPVTMKDARPQSTPQRGAGGMVIHQAPIQIGSMGAGVTADQVEAAVARANQQTVKHIERHVGGMMSNWDRRAG